MSEKNLGYLFLGGGLLVMIGALLIVIFLFTGVIKPYKMIDIKAPSFNTANLVPSIPGLPKPTGEKIEVIPTAALNHMVNLGVQFLLMTFIMSFGFKIADLGVKLLRPIKIEART